MDLITYLPPTARGRTAIVVFVDRFSKMVHFAPGHDTTTAADFAMIFIKEVFSKHELPDKFVSDRDSGFKSAFFQEICKQLGIKQCMSMAYHTQTDGQTERTNRTLEEMLRHFVSPTQDDWDLKLPCAKFAINNAFHAAIGTCPFFLNYGSHPRSPNMLRVASALPAANNFTEKLNPANSRVLQMT